MTQETIEKLDELTKMPLHSSLEVRVNPISGPVLSYVITRVFGGWIYTNELGHPVFIPCYRYDEVSKKL